MHFYDALNLLRTHHGRVVQVVPMKPMLKALKTMRLKLKCDEPLSSFAFKFNLHRYTTMRSKTATWKWRCCST